MPQRDNVIDIRRPVRFTIDGRSYQTTSRRQSAADLLALAGYDPDQRHLGELRTHLVTYKGADIVRIRPGARLVSIPTATQLEADHVTDREAQRETDRDTEPS